MSLGFLKNYLSGINDGELKNSIENTASAILENINVHFDYKTHLNGLLFGNVQSGKTGQMLGAIASLADQKFRLFLVLTTDNIYLQRQTEERIRSSMNGFDVIGETGEVEFRTNGLARPTAIVLKKNARVLRRWRNIISDSKYAIGKPLVIIDDEADASSLNTLVNKNKISTINSHIASIKALFSSSLYLQVTATPQSIVLQTEISNWKPAFVNYFLPGKSYLGGDFFFSDPPSYSIRLTAENEIDDVKADSEYIPDGLRASLMSFLVSCAHAALVGQTTCNYLIHPSVKIADHEVFAKRIGEHLNLLLASSDEDDFQSELNLTWIDLQKTKPDISAFQDIQNSINELIELQKIRIIILNSKTPIEVDYNVGFNIVIGGNSLGRGLTLPKLQTVYYCRKSKTPQADTFWQHSRIFGYDRDQGLVRLYMPPSLHKLFVDLNYANKNILSQIMEKGMDGIQILLPPTIKPTRKNVVDQSSVNLITGGVNYFPFAPFEQNSTVLNPMLSSYDANTESHLVTFESVFEILSNVGNFDSSDWNKTKILNCLTAIKHQRPNVSCRLIVRTDRRISKGTGTLLSPIDRKIGDNFSDAIVLTMYQLTGEQSLGWSGNSFWIPNIKFPDNMCYYNVG